MMTPIRKITDSDMIILQSVDSYLKSLGVPAQQSPQEQLIITQKARDYLYSDIVQRVPRVAGYIMSADLETDTVAQGLYLALSKHAMDPVFVNILMQYLSRTNNANDNGVTGALLAKIMHKEFETLSKKDGKKDSKKKDDDKNVVDASTIDHLRQAVNQLLGPLANIVMSRCGNLTHAEAIAIAACIAMDNRDTIGEIIKSDFPITANLFDTIADPSNIIKAALLLEKSEFTKLSSNQSTFVESLKRWVWDKLNTIPTQTSYQFLIATYGSIKPDVTKYLIQIKDCGTVYSNLLAVAKQLVNQ